MEQSLDTRSEFISILSNAEREFGTEQGTLFLAGPGRDLGKLETDCFDDNLTRNECITARYTLKGAQPELVFGTLFGQLIKDIQSFVARKKLGVGYPEMYGILRELSSGPIGITKHKDITDFPFSWQQFERIAETFDTGLPDVNNQTIDTDKIAKEFMEFSSANNEFFYTGQRLVVFLQLLGNEVDENAWAQYLNKLAKLLPYRVLLVISGLPETLQEDANDPTFRRLDLKVEVEPEPVKKKVKAYKGSAAISDEPSIDDMLNRRRYANALARMLLHKQTSPPFSIGIHGPWGKGKSSFMNQIKKELEDAGKKSKILPVIIKFNAWSYSDAKQVWAGLLNKVSEKIENELGCLNRVMLNLGDVIKQRKAEMFWEIALPAFLLFTAVVLGKFLDINLIELFKTIFAQDKGGLSVELEKAFLPLLGGIGSILFMFKRMAKVMQPVSQRIAHFARLPNYSEELGFQHAVIKDLKFLRKALLKSKPGARVFVFIDDLDRCSENRIMEILQAIILVLAPTKFFVILGIDTEMIWQAIQMHYTRNGAHPPNWFPRQYLKKILQLSFHLPIIEKNDRKKLVASHFSQESQDELAKIRSEKSIDAKVSEPEHFELKLTMSNNLLVEKGSAMDLQKIEISEELVEDTPHELAAFDDYQECMEDNPRDIKRSINIHRLMKFMAQKHGVKIGGWTKNRQRLLVRWVLFCVCWPELIGYALHMAESSKSDIDIIEQCIDKFASKVLSAQRQERLNHIKVKEKDVLTPDDIDKAFAFVARCTLLVEDLKKPAINIKESSTAITT